MWGSEMTLPNERTRAIKQARDFLRSLLDPKQTPKVPKWIRREAYHKLKHFPSDLDMEQVLDGKINKIFGRNE